MCWPCCLFRSILFLTKTAARFLSYPIANVGGAWTAVLKRTPLVPAERAGQALFRSCALRRPDSLLCFR